MHEPGGGEAIGRAAGREMQRDAIAMQVERPLPPIRGEDAARVEKSLRGVLDEGEALRAAAMQQIGVLQFAP